MKLTRLTASSQKIERIVTNISLVKYASAVVFRLEPPLINTPHQSKVLLEALLRQCLRLQAPGPEECLPGPRVRSVQVNRYTLRGCVHFFNLFYLALGNALGQNG